MWLGFLFLVIGLVWFFGPRVTLDENIQPIQLPEDLDRYLHKSESRFNNIQEGLKKEILWNRPKKKPNFLSYTSMVFLQVV